MITKKKPKLRRRVKRSRSADNAITPYVVTSAHEFKWTTREPVPIGEVAETLLALDRIARMCPRVLERLTQVDIADIQVYVDTIESGSLLEKVVVKLIFRDEASFDAFLDKLGERIRQPGMTRAAFIGVVLAVVVGYGAWLAAKVSNPGGQTTISGNNTTIINVGAGMVEMTPEAFQAVVESAIVNQKSLAKETVKLFKPARGDGQSSLVIDGNTATSFPPAVIAATPRLVEVDKQDKVQDIKDADLQIRAMDLDSGKRGWAALIPGLIDRRVRLKLDSNIRPADIADKFSVRADVSVYYKLDRTGKKMVPDYILLREVIEE